MSPPYMENGANRKEGNCTMLTEKENYLRCYRGEMPEWVPRFDRASPGRPPACLRVRPSFLYKDRRKDGGGCDVFGVEYTGTESMGGAALPVPGKYLVPEITRWREFVHAPDLSGIDWETMAARDLSKIDRKETAIRASLHSGYFQALVNMLGYEEGLMAMYEEPDEVKALLGYLSDFFIAFEEKTLEYYKPEIWAVNDDISTAIRPFISLEFYREFIRPLHERELTLAKEHGCHLDMHCCGKADIFVDDWVQMGVESWNPAQVVNDLKGIQEKYPDLVLIGCWDSQGPAGWLDTGEEDTRRFVRECIRDYASTGRFIFYAGVYGPQSDPIYAEKNRWITEEYDAFGRSFYRQKRIKFGK